MKGDHQSGIFQDTIPTSGARAIGWDVEILTLLSLNEIEDKRGGFWPRYIDPVGW